MPKKKSKKGKPQVNEELEGFEIKINEFGSIESNLNPEELNQFLNKHVDDKKLRGRDENLLPIDDKEEEEETLFSDEEE